MGRVGSGRHDSAVLRGGSDLTGFGSLTLAIGALRVCIALGDWAVLILRAAVAHVLQMSRKKNVISSTAHAY